MKSCRVIGQVIRCLTHRQASLDTNTVYWQVDWVYKLCDKKHWLLATYR
jgi:hypothetical protein